MHDIPGSSSRPADSPAGELAALKAEAQAAFALSRAAARALMAASDENRELFRTHLRREVDRLKLSGGGAYELALARLREFTRD